VKGTEYKKRRDYYRIKFFNLNSFKKIKKGECNLNEKI